MLIVIRSITLFWECNKIAHKTSSVFSRTLGVQKTLFWTAGSRRRRCDYSQHLCCDPNSFDRRITPEMPCLFCQLIVFITAKPIFTAFLLWSSYTDYTIDHTRNGVLVHHARNGVVSLSLPTLTGFRCPLQDTITENYPQKNKKIFYLS